MKNPTYIFLFFILLITQKIGYTEDKTNIPLYQNGILNIPSVSVPDGTGCFENYKAELALIPNSSSLSFRLIEVQYISESSSCNINVNIASYQNSILILPIVDVSDSFGQLTAYEAELSLRPFSDLIIFELLSAQIYNPDDPNLQECILKELEENGWENIDEINRLNCSSSNISNIGGIENLVNLEYIDLSHNQILDITPLKKLNNLTNIYIAKNKISDITPLRKLTKLEYLNMGINKISDITPLENLTKLSILTLGDNLISDITPLKKLTSLTYLNLNANKVSNIKPLNKLDSLGSLYLEYNKISDITPLENLTSLTTLLLRDNKISDITPLTNLTSLRYLTLYDNDDISCTILDDLVSSLPSLTSLSKPKPCY